MTNLNDNDLNFCIQILLDSEDKEEDKKKEEEREISSKIENIIKTRLNECMKNAKFKEVPIPTIYRIIESSITSEVERIDVNELLNFIIESASTRFILFKFVELHRLSKDKVNEFMKFISRNNSNKQPIPVSESLS